MILDAKILRISSWGQLQGEGQTGVFGLYSYSAIIATSRADYREVPGPRNLQTPWEEKRRQSEMQKQRGEEPAIGPLKKAVGKGGPLGRLLGAACPGQPSFQT